MVPPSVKYSCSLYIGLFHVCVSFIAVHSVFYACPQLIDDVENRLSGGRGFGNAAVKEECSLQHSNCINNEGSPAMLLDLVLFGAHMRCF